MNKLIALLLPILALGLSMSQLIASPLDDKIAALKSAIKIEVADRQSKASAAGTNPANEEAVYRYTGALNMFNSSLENEVENPNSEAALQQMLSLFTSDGVQKAGHDLMDEIKRERQAKEDAYAAKVDDVVKSASDIILKATKPADLDQLLVDLQNVQQGGRQNYGAQDMQNTTQRAQAAYQFVAGWQDYLSESGGGKIDQALNALRGLSQNNAPALVPRSAILDRINQLSAAPPSGPPGSPPETATQIVEGIQTPDDMAAALKRIETLPQTPNDYDLSRAIQALHSFVTEYDNTKAGLPVAFAFGSPVFAPQFNNPKLYTQLWLFFLVHEFDAFKGPPPVEGESPQQFLERVFADAEQRQDWHELQQAYLAHAYLQRNSLFSTGGSPHDTTGFESMLAGLNQETAGQYTAAVLSYEQALKVPDTYLPAKFIGDRLNGIQKDHPDDYAKALQLAGLASAGTAPSGPASPTAPH